MPSKPMTLLILIVAVAGAYGLAQVERKRDVPWLPPQLETLIAAIPPDGMVEPVAPHGTTGGASPVPVPPKPTPRSPEPAVAHSLVSIEAKAAVAPKSGDMDTVVTLKIGPDGTYLRWGSYDPGSLVMVFGFLKKAASANPDFQLVIAPDKATPWKYVYWAMELARESGVHDVGLGVTAMEDKTALPGMQIYAAPQPKDPYLPNPDFPEIRVVVTIKADGKPSWTVDGKEVTGRQELYSTAGGINSEYAEMLDDADYARNPSNTHWLVVAGPEIPAKDVIQTLAALRQASIYTVRFGGEFPPNPGLAK
jgi:biopolymer transport protein ExbD